MTRPRLLELFAGEGGAAYGYRVDLGYVLPFIDTTHAGNLIAAVHMLCQPDQVDPRALAHAAMTGQDDDR